MSRLLEYRVPPDCRGMTVREFVRKRLEFSARFLTEQRKLPEGVLKNGLPARTVDVLEAGDLLAFSLPEERGSCPPVPLPVAVLWETQDYLAVDKPAAMPVHPSPGHGRDSLLNALAQYGEDTGQSCRFRPLYRLDRDTSGVLVVGKHRAAVSARLEKRYYAVCQGTLSGSGVIDLPIGLQPGSRIVRECGHGDRAVTHWRALASQDGHTLLSLRLETGRTHQIRVHLSHLGHPLAGDDLYGGSREKLGRQALHCGALRIVCPALETERVLLSQFPADLREAFPWLPPLETMLKEEFPCPPV